MRSEHWILRVACLLSLLALLWPLSAAAQDAGGQSTSAPEENKKMGDYIVSQSVEFGYRATFVKGAQLPCPIGTADRSSAGLCQDESMYNTLVNLHTGPRLLEQTLSLRSPGHNGALFDNLFISSFGFGGDPNDVARVRVSKMRVYNLVVNFRRDHNFFGYDLLTNPLNPPTPGNPLVLFSPHSFSNVRRMTDVDLTIAPQSAISLRLGYSRNRNEGPVFSTFHMPHGTDILLPEDWNTTSDLYRAGLDFRIIPRTTISFDGAFEHFKGDNFWTNPPLSPLFGAGDVNFGISFNVPANQPCPASFVGTVGCNLDQAFARKDRFRTTIPTEQFSFQSHYFKRLDLSGRFMYSHSHMNGAWNQSWTGLAASFPRPGSTGSFTRQEIISANPANKRDAASADFGMTIHLTEKLRILDNFRWINWRIPTFEIKADTTWSLVGGLGAVTALTPLSAMVVTPTFSATARFWKEERKENEVSLEYDFTHAVGARIGYRFTDRFLLDRDETTPLVSPFEGSPAAGDTDTGEDRASATIHTGLAGLWIRPSEKFRMSVDGELSSAHQETGGGATGIDPNTTFGLGPLTRITPRHEQQYRVRLNYNPQRWMVVSGTFNLRDESNDLFSDNYSLSSRYLGLGAMFIPNDRFTWDIAYTYNSYNQTDLICPIGSIGGVPFAAGAPFVNTACPFDIGTNGLPTGLYQTLGRFDNVNHFFSTLLSVKLIPRVTTGVGYSIVNSDGSEIFTNQFLVPGALKNSFHRPLAELQVELSKNWFAKAGWNYYGYNEKGSAGPTQPRDFHANTATVSLKYAF